MGTIKRGNLWFWRYTEKGEPHHSTGGFSRRSDAVRDEMEHRNVKTNSDGTITLTLKEYRRLVDQRKRAVKDMIFMESAMQDLGIHAERKNAITFGELVDDWLRYKKRRNARESYLQKVRMTKYFPRKWHREPTNTISPDMIRKFLEDVADRSSTYYSNRFRSWLRDIYNFGIRHKGLKINPIASTDPFDYQQPEKVIPQDMDVVKVHKTIRNLKPIRWYYIYTVMLDTCCRIKSALRLKWSDIHFEGGNPAWKNGQINITDYKAGKVKDKKRVTPLPMTKRLRETLLEWRAITPDQDNPLVFPSNNGDEIKNYGWLIKKACKAAKVESFTWTSIRPYGATRLRRLGVSYDTISKILGHSSPEMTRRYIRAYGYEEEMEEALETNVQEIERDVQISCT